MAPRLTPQRRAVLETLEQAGVHLSAAEVYERVRGRQPRIGHGTVYAALHFLVRAGRVVEVRRPDGVVSYDSRLSQHDHAACRLCGALADVELGLRPEYAQAEAQTGFRIERHALELVGLCPRCQARAGMQE